MAENLEKALLAEWREERDELDKLIATLEKRIATRRGTTKQSDLFGDTSTGKTRTEVVVFNEDRPVTIPDGSERILRDVGRPLHAKKLVEGLARMGKVTTVNSLNGSLPQDPKNRFKRVAPSTFALREWELKEG
jgi:hypothetical protein